MCAADVAEGVPALGQGLVPVLCQALLWLGCSSSCRFQCHVLVAVPAAGFSCRVQLQFQLQVPLQGSVAVPAAGSSCSSSCSAVVPRSSVPLPEQSSRAASKPLSRGKHNPCDILLMSFVSALPADLPVCNSSSPQSHGSPPHGCVPGRWNKIV